MIIENVNNNDFTAYLESLGSYDGSLSLKDNIEYNAKFMEQEIKEMDITQVDSDVLMQQYKTVILGNNVFDGTINWGVINTLYFLIKNKMEEEVIRRIQNKELVANNEYGNGVALEDSPYDFEDYNDEELYEWPRGVVCTLENGQSIEHKTALFQATAINMCVQFLLKNGNYSSDRINHKIAGFDASNIGVLAMVAEGQIFTVYLPNEISKEQLASLMKECIHRDNYKFKVVHNGVVYGVEEALNYLDAINVGGSHLAKKMDEPKLTLK